MPIQDATPVRLTLPAITDSLAYVRIRFRLNTEVNTNAAGWDIDNIILESGRAQRRADQLNRIFKNGFDL